jgi:hypothetical protein
VNQDPEVGLGFFSAASSIARQGQPNHYVLRVANAARHSLELTIAIRVKAAQSVDPSEQHYASYAKKIVVYPRTSTTIAIECDWMGQCDFQVDGVSSPPDDCWRREIAVPRLCSLAALLYDAMEAQLDTLTIYQKFTE